MYLPTWGKLLKTSPKDIFDDVYAICFLIFFIKSICCGYSFELHLVDAIQMVTHNICLYKADKKYTGCNLLDCALIGVCALIRANTVPFIIFFTKRFTESVILVHYTG